MFSRISISRMFSVLLIVVMLIGSAAFPTSVRADSIITVNSFDDNTAVNGFCTLREAITNANNNAATYGDCVAGSETTQLSSPAVLAQPPSHSSQPCLPLLK